MLFKECGAFKFLCSHILVLELFLIILIGGNQLVYSDILINGDQAYRHPTGDAYLLLLINNINKNNNYSHYLFKLGQNHSPRGNTTRCLFWVKLGFRG